jgi:hypothetical protein
LSSSIAGEFRRVRRQAPRCFPALALNGIGRGEFLCYQRTDVLMGPKNRRDISQPQMWLRSELRSGISLAAQSDTQDADCGPLPRDVDALFGRIPALGA